MPEVNREQAVRVIVAAAEESVSILPEIAVILRTLSAEDDEFVIANHLDTARFRKMRRQVFAQVIQRVKRHFRRVQEERRDLMYHAGRVDMESLMSNDLAFTRALLSLRAALCMHYLRIGFAAELVRKACGEINACVAIQDSFRQRILSASQT